MGPLTGRGAGYCAGSGVPGYMNPAAGRGFGFGGGGFYGRGGGRGWRHRYYATGLPGWAWSGIPFGHTGPFGPNFSGENARKQEMEALREQADFLKKSLEDVTARIGELEASADEGK